MSKEPFSKLQSSLSLEDLLAQSPPRNSQNWLLTYLDVFVLIVMLVITLITLSDINTQQQQAVANKAKSQAHCPPVKSPIISNCPPAIIAETNLPKQPLVIEHKTEVTPDKLDVIIQPKESNTNINTADKTPENIINDNKVKSPAKVSQIDTVAEENKLQQQLAKKIDEFGLNKSVNIKVTQGYAQLEIQDKVLFKSSESKLTSSGEALIKRLTPLLKQAVGLILIEGHTDNIPIKSSQFPSNWELGSARATSVLHFLVAQNLDSIHLRAITYADTMPIADNSTAKGRETNRRVNILIKFPEQ